MVAVVVGAAPVVDGVAAVLGVDMAAAVLLSPHTAAEANQSNFNLTDY